jgi:hypothetical protein
VARTCLGILFDDKTATISDPHTKSKSVDVPYVSKIKIISYLYISLLFCQKKQVFVK